jgi:competence protein ComEC
MALWRAMGELFAAERERWPLWLPVAFAAGIALYFALKAEPSAIALRIIAGMAVLALPLGWYFARGRVAGQIAAALMFLAAAGAFGFSVVGWRAAEVAAPVLAKRIGPVPVTGRLVAVEPGFKGARITIEDPEIPRLAAAETPKRVRLRLLRRDGSGLALGDTIRVTATLMPPPAPAAPGAYDFARDAWFQRLGAVGFAYGQPRVVAREGGAAAEGPKAAFMRWMAEARRTLHGRVTALVPGDRGAMTSALLTGDQGGISPVTMDAMRDSGLAHILSISGLHLALVAGILFFSMRAALALSPVLALEYPIKKWAAGFALVGIAIYTLFTGAAVPTQRSFLMAGIVLFAVMVDRNAISMRLLAWAAVAVLLVAPESLLGPSFQMSFAAVGGLIAAFELARPMLSRLRGEGGFWGSLRVALAGAVLTTLVAGTATAVPSLYHFNRVAILGLVANFAAVPVTSFWVMPWAVISYILAPIGLDGFAIRAMSWGVEAIIWIASTVASWPGAATRLPEMPGAAFALVMFGFAWLMLWRWRLRRWGAAFVAFGAIMTLMARPPDLLVAGDAQSFAVRDGGGMLLVGEKIGRFERETWLRRAGLDPVAETGSVQAAWPPSGGAKLACDAAACLYRGAGGVRVSLVREPSAAIEDCRRAHVVVALVSLPRIRCSDPKRFIGRFDLWREGAHALWFDNGGAITVRTVAAERGARPWVPVRGR